MTLLCDWIGRRCIQFNGKLPIFNSLLEEQDLHICSVCFLGNTERLETGLPWSSHYHHHMKIYESTVNVLSASSASNSYSYRSPPSLRNMAPPSRSRPGHLNGVVNSQYSGYQPADSQSIKPVTCPSCTRTLCKARSPCVKTVLCSISFNFFAASRALR